MQGLEKKRILLAQMLGVRAVFQYWGRVGRCGGFGRMRTGYESTRVEERAGARRWLNENIRGNCDADATLCSGLSNNVELTA